MGPGGEVCVYSEEAPWLSLTNLHMMVFQFTGFSIFEGAGNCVWFVHLLALCCIIDIVLAYLRERH